MPTPPSAEFRDLDGSYLLVRPLDDVRCRVLASNVARKGELLYKDERLSWAEAERDMGGYTRVSPSELLAAGGDVPGFDSSDDRDLLLGRGPSEPDPHACLEEKRPSTDRGADDPRAELLRLALHYRRVHVRSGSAFVVCRCPGTSPVGNPRAARLHALISIALVTRKLPSLSRLLGAIRAASGARPTVA